MRIIDTYTIFGSWPAGGADLSLERLLQTLEANGVEKAIAHSTDCVFETTRGTLGSLLEKTAEHANLVPAAAVDPTLLVKPWEFAAEAASKGLACLRFFPEIHDWPVADYLPFAKCLEAIAPTQTPVSVAITRTGQITALSRVPHARDLPVILVHVADDCMSEAAAVVPGMENWYLSTDGMSHLGLLEELADAIGPERLLFGSSAPRGSLTGSLEYVRRSALPDAAKEAILSGNALRLFGDRLGDH